MTSFASPNTQSEVSHFIVRYIEFMKQVISDKYPVFISGESMLAPGDVTFTPPPVKMTHQIINYSNGQRIVNHIKKQATKMTLGSVTRYGVSALLVWDIVKSVVRPDDANNATNTEFCNGWAENIAHILAEAMLESGCISHHLEVLATGDDNTGLLHLQFSVHPESAAS